MKTIKQLILLSLFMFGSLAYAQVGIGTNSPNHALEIESSTSGVVIPRLNISTELSVTAVNGTMVYDTNPSFLCVRAYEDGAWSGCLSDTGGGTTTRSLTTVSVGGTYTVQESDDIIRYTGNGAVAFTFPSTVPLGTEYVVLNNGSDGFSIVTLSNASGSTTSLSLSANTATTVIHIGGGVYAALHSF